jgi:spermidine synthase
MENWQYGQRLEFETVDTLEEFNTPRSYVQYVRTRSHGSVLLMDGEVQFGTLDEHRYHEMLVHPVMQHIGGVSGVNVLILGGGDGLAAREVFRWPNVANVTIVDYDAMFVDVFGRDRLGGQNDRVFTRPNLHYVDQDASEYLQFTPELFDAILIDLPDPDSPEMQNLYINLIVRAKRCLLPSHGVLGLHVGPALLDPAHRQWDFIRTSKQTLTNEFSGLHPTVKFGSIYVPTFSNEWGFLWMRLGRYSRSAIDVTASVERECLLWASDADLVYCPADTQAIYRRRL